MGDGEETAGSRVENDMRPTRPTRPTIVLLLTALSTLACRSERSPAAPPTVEITYWLVAGRRTQKYAAGPGLKDVDKVLAAVADADGPMEFTPVDRLRPPPLPPPKAGDHPDAGAAHPRPDARARRGRLPAAAARRARDPGRGAPDRGGPDALRRAAAGRAEWAAPSMTRRSSACTCGWRS